MRLKTERQQRVEVIHTETEPNVKLHTHTHTAIYFPLTHIYTHNPNITKHTLSSHIGRREYKHYHTRCKTCAGAQKLLWEMLLEN